VSITDLIKTSSKPDWRTYANDNGALKPIADKIDQAIILATSLNEMIDEINADMMFFEDEQLDGLNLGELRNVLDYIVKLS
jgi:hypothetical protein